MNSTDDRRRERYLRHERAAGIDADALQRSRLVVVGAGAVGNEVVKNAVLLGVGRIEVHDFDRIERHNLTRSVFFRDDDVGRPKAATLAARAGEVDPHVTVTAVEGDAWRTLSLDDLQGASALVAAVDQFEARMRLSRLAWLAGVDFVTLAIDSRHASIETFPYRVLAAGARQPVPPRCACYECHLPASAYRQVADRYSCGWLRRALWAQRTVPTTAITASIAGALGVQAALRLGGEATGAAGDAATARRLLVDTRSGASTASRLERQADCPACGRYSRWPWRIAAGSDWAKRLAGFAARDDAVELSEALVFGAECTRCGVTEACTALVGARAGDLDDRVLRCAGCGDLSVRLDLRAETTVADLVGRFAGSRPPIKFLIAGAGDVLQCLDFEAPGPAGPTP